VADDPAVGDDELPYRHNPIRNLPWLDTRVEYEVFQHRPGLSQRLAEWCGGEVAFTDQLVVRVPAQPSAVARLGDFVVRDGERFWVERAEDGFFLRYWPVGKDPGWSHRCYMDWEERE
jgi:hypothetical protein